MAVEDIALKSFMLEHFDFDELKKIGFYPKGTRRKDYQAQADRVCYYFTFDSVFEYLLIGANCQGVHISYTKDHFKCPVCTCEQIITGGTPPQFTFKCCGCKRELVASMTWTGYNISEKGGFNEKTETCYDKLIKFVEKL